MNNMSNEKPRLSPEKFLRRAEDEERQRRSGKLKIYFGAAPGVGKTHTMLEDALSKRAKGVDVVIGVVESHGRVEVEALLKNFEVLPRQSIAYQGKTLMDLDLDAVLERNPGLVLIDEMAHTNAPGLRHKKRWQDIKELLDRRIDVYTTLNVQHVESLNESVSQILGIGIHETVPDSILEAADTIELVDIPPEDLIKRLEEGKVYFPVQAGIAARHFFRKGNLTALRELALRVTAALVKTKVLLYRQDLGIKRIWPTAEKVLVCVGATAKSIQAIHTAKRMATGLQAEWIAVHVESPQRLVPKQEYRHILENLHLAEQLGATIYTLSGFDIVKELMNFAREQNVTQIVVAKQVRPRTRALFFRDLADEIVRFSGEIDVYVITSSSEKFKLPPKKPSKPPIEWGMYVFSFGMVFLATAIDLALYPFLNLSNLMMVYLLCVTLVALMGRSGPSIMASILSVLAFDFFFVPPIYSLLVEDVQGLFTLFVMLLVTQIIGYLMVLSRRQMRAARFAHRQIATLHKLSRQLATTRGEVHLLEIGVRYLAELFNCGVMGFLPAEGRHLAIAARANAAEQALSQKEQDVAQWVYEMRQMAGLGTDTLGSAEALYLPLVASQGSVGVLRFLPETPSEPFSVEQIYLLESCAQQVALAMEVDRLHQHRENI